MTMLAQKPKQLFRSPFEHPLLAPGQFHGRIPHRNGHRLLLALCAQAGADHTPGPEVDPQTVTDRNDPAFEPIGALVWMIGCMNVALLAGMVGSNMRS